MSNSSELLEEHREDLDEEWHDVFESLTAQGKSPTGIKAAIEYVSTDKSQKEVADEFGVSDVTIRNLQTAVIALGPSECISGIEQSDRRKMDYCKAIADRLGWEEGEEYSVTETYGTPSPSLRKKGWKSLFEKLAEDDPEDDQEGSA